jgi:hypothetical protein
MNKLSLSVIWKLRMSYFEEGNKLRAEGNKLWAEGNKMWAEGYNLWAEGNKLRAEGNKLRAEGDKLWAEGNKLWAEAIIDVHGNIRMEWKNWNEDKQAYECHLETGEVFKP